MSWQPIETAPKDGRWILVHCNWSDPSEDWARVVRYNKTDGWFVWQEMTAESIAFGPTIAEHVPTHWMPLPEPPEQARNETD